MASQSESKEATLMSGGTSFFFFFFDFYYLFILFLIACQMAPGCIHGSAYTLPL